MRPLPFSGRRRDEQACSQTLSPTTTQAHPDIFGQGGGDAATPGDPLSETAHYACGGPIQQHPRGSTAEAIGLPPKPAAEAHNSPCGSATTAVLPPPAAAFPNPIPPPLSKTSRGPSAKDLIVGGLARLPEALRISFGGGGTSATTTPTPRANDQHATASVPVWGPEQLAALAETERGRRGREGTGIHAHARVKSAPHVSPSVPRFPSFVGQRTATHALSPRVGGEGEHIRVAQGSTHPRDQHAHTTDTETVPSTLGGGSGDSGAVNITTGASLSSTDATQQHQQQQNTATLPSRSPYYLSVPGARGYGSYRRVSAPCVTTSDKDVFDDDFMSELLTSPVMRILKRESAESMSMFSGGAVVSVGAAGGGGGGSATNSSQQPQAAAASSAPHAPTPSAGVPPHSAPLHRGLRAHTSQPEHQHQQSQQNPHLPPRCHNTQQPKGSPCSSVGNHGFVSGLRVGLGSVGQQGGVVQRSGDDALDHAASIVLQSAFAGAEEDNRAESPTLNNHNNSSTGNPTPHSTAGGVGGAGDGESGTVSHSAAIAAQTSHTAATPYRQSEETEAPPHSLTRPQQPTPAATATTRAEVPQGFPGLPPSPSQETVLSNTSNHSSDHSTAGGGGGSKSPHTNSNTRSSSPASLVRRVSAKSSAALRRVFHPHAHAQAAAEDAESDEKETEARTGMSFFKTKHPPRSPLPLFTSPAPPPHTHAHTHLKENSSA